MKRLKKKFRKVKKKTKLVRVVPKIGRWCIYYSGRLPYPIECQWNKVPPLNFDKPKCADCNRDVKWQDWKNGMWDKIKSMVISGENLINEDPPVIYKKEK